MIAYTVTTEHQMQDGRIFSCKYPVIITSGRLGGRPEDSYPDESEAGEPTYYIDNKEVDSKDLATEFSEIADKLYEAGYGEYSYSESEWNYDDGLDYSLGYESDYC